MDIAYCRYALQAGTSEESSLLTPNKAATVISRLTSIIPGIVEVFMEPGIEYQNDPATANLLEEHQEWLA